MSFQQSNTDAKWRHKWGFADTEFIIHEDSSIEMTGNRYLLCGYKMYDFIPFIERIINSKISQDSMKQEIEDKQTPAPIINENFFEVLKEKFNAGQYTMDDEVRLEHSHGQTSIDEIYQVFYDRISRAVDLVFYPYTDYDVEIIVQLACIHNICLIPYGGGTSVSNALTVPESELRMVVSIDMAYMNKIVWIDKANLRACVQAGITGLNLEKELAQLGFTAGHEPDSIEFSTLGGWIATHASGMKKNKYGNIEDIVETFTLQTPSGKMELASPQPRVSMGMNPVKLLFGNEGNLGIIVNAIIKIHPKPRFKKYQSVVFPSLDSGIAFLRELYTRQLLPASIRLMDNTQFKMGQALNPKYSKFQSFIRKLQFKLLELKKFNKDNMVVATLVFEDDRDKVILHEKKLLKLAKQFNGIKGGSTNGQRGYNLTFVVAYLRELAFKLHLLSETMETTVPWNKIQQVYASVVNCAYNKHHEFSLPGKPLICVRITQIYHTGVCMYFTYLISCRNVSQPAKVFSKIEHALRETILINGGSISHHHGVGKLRKDFMFQVLSQDTIKMLQKFKQSIDPQNIFGISNNIFSLDEINR